MAEDHLQYTKKTKSMKDKIQDEENNYPKESRDILEKNRKAKIKHRFLALNEKRNVLK